MYDNPVKLLRRPVAVIALVVASCAVSFADSPTTATPSPKAVKSAKTVKSAKVAKAAESATLVYECPDCHDKFTEAQARKAGMKCSCCQTKLVPIAKTKTTHSAAKKG